MNRNHRGPAGGTSGTVTRGAGSLPRCGPWGRCASDRDVVVALVRAVVRQEQAAQAVAEQGMLTTLTRKETSTRVGVSESAVWS